MINDYSQSAGEWKIQLIILNRCISSTNFEETRFIHLASNNIKMFSGSDTGKVIHKLFDTLLKRFLEAKETSFERASKFIFENVDLLYYYFHKIDIKRGGSYIKPPEWIKHKLTPKKINDDYCLKHAVPAVLDHKDIGRDPQRISKIKPFISKYNWEG